MARELVSVILTVKNEERVIERCLSSVENQVYKPVEIIVVDNNSSDRTVELAKKYAKIVLTKGPERSAQRNFGASKARGKYFFFIDADMELEPDAVEKAVRVCNKRNHGALVIGEQFFGRGYWAKCKALEKRCYIGTGDAEAARFIRKEIFSKAGGYDEELTGPEDIDLQKRLKSITSIGGSDGIIHYDEHVSFAAFLRKRYYYSMSLRRYFAKNKYAREKEFRFIRAAFLKNWKLLLKDPLHCFGFFILRFGEGLATLLALYKTR